MASHKNTHLDRHSYTKTYTPINSTDIIQLESFSTKAFQVSASELLKYLEFLEVDIHGAEGFCVFIWMNEFVYVCVESELYGGTYCIVNVPVH